MSNIGALPSRVALFVPTSLQQLAHLSHAYYARFQLRPCRVIERGQPLFGAVDGSGHCTGPRIHAGRFAGAKDPVADALLILSSGSDPRDTC